MSDGLVEFVRQCLARDEEIAAMIAGGGMAPERWEIEPAEREHWSQIVRYCRTNIEAPEDAYREPGEEGIVALVPISRWEDRHIARHDPARVLSEVAAKRTILDRHEPGVSEPSECGRCNDPWPCDDVKALAQPYAGEPGWQEEWRL